MESLLIASLHFTGNSEAYKNAMNKGNREAFKNAMLECLKEAGNGCTA